MRKRRVIILAAAFVAMLGGLAWLAVASRTPALPDPVYGGHSLSQWLGLSAWPADQVRIEFPVEALDSNALPLLTESIKRRDSAFHRKYLRLWSHLPAWLRNHVIGPTSEDAIRSKAFGFLEELGTNARPAIPELVRLMRTDDDFMVRQGAVAALGEIATHDDTAAVEALAAIAKDKNAPWWSDFADRALYHFDPEAAVGVGFTNVRFLRRPRGPLTNIPTDTSPASTRPGANR